MVSGTSNMENPVPASAPEPVVTPEPIVTPEVEKPKKGSKTLVTDAQKPEAPLVVDTPNQLDTALDSLTEDEKKARQREGIQV